MITLLRVLLGLSFAVFCLIGVCILFGSVIGLILLVPIGALLFLL